MKSCIYTGHVAHYRYRPVTNGFRYALFMMYLDLAELERIFQGRAFWSAGRPNLAWFRRQDFLGDPELPLDTAVRDLLQERLGRRPPGPIRLLAHLRYFGHIFNPVAFYYIFDSSDSRVESIVANITNTPWGERFSYVLDEARNIGVEEEKHFHFAKIFHVSPFLGMDMEYDWRFSRPGEDLRVRMTNYRREEKLFTARLDLKRREMNGANLARMLISYPPITIKTISAIYWQALKLWIKGAVFYPHPEKGGSR
jgi:DUF1365 family protein